MFSVCISIPFRLCRYYQQEISYSDDPFTDFIEPAVPFVLGTLVRNAGAGEATDVSLVSGQPEIIENEQGGSLSQVDCTSLRFCRTLSLACLFVIAQDSSSPFSWSRSASTDSLPSRCCQQTLET